MNNEKTKCKKCGKDFYMTNPEAGCPYCNSLDKDINTIASIFKIIAWIILVIGFIAGLANGANEYDVIDSISLIETWSIYFSIFLGTYALGKIIQILHDIRAKLYRK